MIDESRENFTKWVLDIYQELHDCLFDASGKFKMERTLSGEMLCYAIVKPWYKRVRSSEYLLEDADIRQEVSEEQVKDVRDYLSSRDEDMRAYLVRWFLPRENGTCGEIDFDLVTTIAGVGMVRWMKQTLDAHPDWTMDDVGDYLAERLQDYRYDFIEEMVYLAMDYVDGMNREGKDVPEDLRVIARNLEAREEPNF